MILFVVTSLIAQAPPPLVDMTSAIPDAVIEMRYATNNNFLKKPMYPENARCLALSPLVEKLVLAAKILRKQGYRLKFYDCYRPLSVQRTLWQAFPVRGYVADPSTGSHHNRGAAVDVTLADSAGHDVEMPTEFDAFNQAAHHKYQGGSADSKKHRGILRSAMELAGLNKNPNEWWHYDLVDAIHFPLREEPFVDAGLF